MILHLMKVTPTASLSDEVEFVSTERNEDEDIELLVPWEGIIPDSVFEEIAEREFQEQEGNIL